LFSTAGFFGFSGILRRYPGLFRTAGFFSFAGILRRYPGLFSTAGFFGFAGILRRYPGLLRTAGFFSFAGILRRYPGFLRTAGFFGFTGLLRRGGLGDRWDDNRNGGLALLDRLRGLRLGRRGPGLAGFPGLASLRNPGGFAGLGSPFCRGLQGLDWFFGPGGGRGLRGLDWFLRLGNRFYRGRSGFAGLKRGFYRRLQGLDRRSGLAGPFGWTGFFCRGFRGLDWFFGLSGCCRRGGFAGLGRCLYRRLQGLDRRSGLGGSFYRGFRGGTFV
jgi:hypothetical protein